MVRRFDAYILIWESYTTSADCLLLPPSADGPPPSKREVFGEEKSKVCRISAGARCAPLQRGRNRNGEMRLQRWAASLQRLDAFATDGCIAVPRRGAHCAPAFCTEFALGSIHVILYLIRRGQSMSLPFSGGNIRPERKKFNKSNSPLSPPLTALKFLNIPALFFRNSLDFAARHRLQ